MPPAATPGSTFAAPAQRSCQLRSRAPLVHTAPCRQCPLHLAHGAHKMENDHWTQSHTESCSNAALPFTARGTLWGLSSQVEIPFPLPWDACLRGLGRAWGRASPRAQRSLASPYSLLPSLYTHFRRAPSLEEKPCSYQGLQAGHSARKERVVVEVVGEGAAQRESLEGGPWAVAAAGAMAVVAAVAARSSLGRSLLLVLTPACTHDRNREGKRWPHRRLALGPRSGVFSKR